MDYVIIYENLSKYPSSQRTSVSLRQLAGIVSCIVMMKREEESIPGCKVIGSAVDSSTTIYAST